jgi:hypothetical protein
MTVRKNPALTGKLYAPMPCDTSDEKWRDVADYEGLYIVSDVGRLYSINRGLFMRLSMNGRGYYHTAIGTKDTGYRKIRIHAVVSRAFIGECPEGKEVNHKNGIKSDNRASNLEYVVHSRNVQHAYDIGLRKRIGGEHGKHTLTEKDVRRVRRRYRDLGSKRHGFIKQVADEYEVTPTCIWSIVHNKVWPNVTV